MHVGTFWVWCDPFHPLILICTINVLPIQFHSCVQLQVDWYCLFFVVIVFECLHKLYCLFFVVVFECLHKLYCFVVVAVVFEYLHFTNCTCLLFSTLQSKLYCSQTKYFSVLTQRLRVTAVCILHCNVVHCCLLYSLDSDLQLMWGCMEIRML